MKALQVPQAGQVRLIDQEPRRAGAGQARLRLRALGLCGSDLNIFLGQMPLVSYPRIIGHEVAAEVLEADDPTGRIRPGELVTVEPYFPCGRCAACRQGRPNCCRSSQTLGVQREGCAAEEFVLPVEKLHVPPARLEPTPLALAEPLGVGFHAAQRGQVRAADRVLVLGAGPIGLAAMQAARVLGGRVAVVDLKAANLAVAAELGAELALQAGQDDVLGRVLTWTDGEGADVVIEAVGSRLTIEETVELAAAAGRVVLIGYGARQVHLDPKAVVSKELDLRGSRNSLGVFPRVLSLLAEGRLRVGPLISRVVPLAEAPEALREWAAHPEAVIKIVVTCP